MANYTASDRLAGPRVAILITDGFEQVETTEPRIACRRITSV